MNVEVQLNLCICTHNFRIFLNVPALKFVTALKFKLFELIYLPFRIYRCEYFRTLQVFEKVFNLHDM